MFLCHLPSACLSVLQVGSVVFSGDRPKNYNFIIESADKDENIRLPAVANITDEMRSLMPLTPDWTYWPDYDRVSSNMQHASLACAEHHGCSRCRCRDRSHLAHTAPSWAQLLC